MIQPYKRFKQIILSVGFWFLLTKPKETIIFLHDKTSIVNEKVESFLDKNEKEAEDTKVDGRPRTIRTALGDVEFIVKPIKIDVDAKEAAEQAYEFFKSKSKPEKQENKKPRDTKLINSIVNDDDCGVIEDCVEDYYDNLENWEDF